jgi:transposase
VRVREQLVESSVLAKQHLDTAPAAAARFFRAQIRQLKTQLAEIQKQLRQAWQEVPEMAQAIAWLTSIPGVGEITAVTLLSILPPLDQIDSARQLAAFAGVTPAQKQSGNNPGKTRMSKLGHSRLRRALYLPALAAVRCNPRAKALAQRLSAKGKKRMVIVGAVMRLLLHLAFGVLKNRAPFDPNYLETCPSN